MDPVTGSLMVAGLGMSAYGAFKGGSGSAPDYGQAGQLYTLRRQEIGDFAQQLAGARASYLTSLNNMYNQAYSRFSGNAEAGFAARGLQVNGGAFASALANKAADYQAQLAPMAFQAEREDLNSVNNAYAQAAGMNASMVSGGPMAQFDANRQNAGGFGQLLGQYGMMAARGGFGGGTGSPGSNPNSLGLTTGYSSGSGAYRSPGFDPLRG